MGQRTDVIIACRRSSNVSLQCSLPKTPSVLKVVYCVYHRDKVSRLSLIPSTTVEHCQRGMRNGRGRMKSSWIHVALILMKCQYHDPYGGGTICDKHAFSEEGGWGSPFDGVLGLGGRDLTLSPCSTLKKNRSLLRVVNGPCAGYLVSSSFRESVKNRCKKFARIAGTRLSQSKSPRSTFGAAVSRWITFQIPFRSQGVVQCRAGGGEGGGRESVAAAVLPVPMVDRERLVIVRYEWRVFRGGRTRRKRG